MSKLVTVSSGLLDFLSWLVSVDFCASQSVDSILFLLAQGTENQGEENWMLVVYVAMAILSAGYAVPPK